MSVPTVGDVDDDKVRAAMLDEALIIVDGLWSGAPVSVDGTFYQIRRGRPRSSGAGSHRRGAAVALPAIRAVHRERIFT